MSRQPMDFGCRNDTSKFLLERLNGRAAKEPEQKEGSNTYWVYSSLVVGKHRWLIRSVPAFPRKPNTCTCSVCVPPEFPKSSTSIMIGYAPPPCELPRSRSITLLTFLLTPAIPTRSRSAAETDHTTTPRPRSAREPFSQHHPWLGLKMDLEILPHRTGILKRSNIRGQSKPDLDTGGISALDRGIIKSPILCRCSPLIQPILIVICSDSGSWLAGCGIIPIKPS